MHGNVPVRFGRGRLDSLGNKGLAAYLIACARESLGKEESDVGCIEETFRRNPVGQRAHPEESGQQPEASLASWRGDPPGEA
jgi:hypothetical protein